ncbi:hypothetical protein [Xanthomonas arboricola]|uniref:Large polyvalent protein associated domain-containing protein n=1 Tax=Xanthomonas arboricola TaxID=56448 RepID=A0AB73H1V6_9XANT|nr:hypothetical protein [Xanthomonas arboricola]MBB5672330.1 hypothetical protein [Xanthomonas arboricola]
MRWPDLTPSGAELVVEDFGDRRQLAILTRPERKVRHTLGAAAAKLGFKAAGVGRFVRSELSISLSQIRAAFPGAAEAQVDQDSVLRDRDPLRQLKAAMRRQMRDEVPVDDLMPAAPDVATMIRAKAIKDLLGIQPVFFRNRGDDSRLSFEAVDLRRRGDRRVYVNVDSALPITAVLGHEALHRMRHEAPALYDDLVAALRPHIDQRAYGRHALRLRNISRDQDAALISDDALREEAVADIVGDMLNTGEVWARIDDRELITRLIEFLRAFLAQLAQLLRRKEPAVQGTIGGMELLRDVEAARDAVTGALSDWRDKARPVAEVAPQLDLAFRQANGEPQEEWADEATFAASKVRRADGTLLPVFRGEWGPLAESSFSASKLLSLTFSSSPDVASVNALTQLREWSPDNFPRVTAAYLNLRAPLTLGYPMEDVVGLDFLSEKMTAGGKVTDHEVRTAFAATKGYIRHLPAGADPQIDDWEDFSGDPAELQPWDYAYAHDVADNPEFVELAKKAGFDGFIFTGLFTSADEFTRHIELAVADGYDDRLSQSPEYRAFYEHQVKSVYHSDFSAQFKRLWHGSPYHFQTPSLDYNLSGEGFNAQGFGLYLAERRVVGEHYRDMTSVRTQPIRIGRRLVPGEQALDVITETHGEEGRHHLQWIISLLTSGYRREDVAHYIEAFEEPRRTQTREIFNMVELFNRQTLAQTGVLVCHERGADGLRNEYIGESLLRRDVAHYLDQGMTLELAKAQAAEDIGGRAASLLLQGQQDAVMLSALEAAVDKDSDAIQRARERLRDTQWFLREADSAVRLFEDPSILIFDVRLARVSGQLYEADISDDAVLLDWDRPLKEQGLSGIFDQFPGDHGQLLRDRLNSLPFEVAPEDRTGGDLYGELAQLLGSQRAASDELNRIGLAGLRYPDAFSRGADGIEHPTYNYVVWDLTALEKFAPAFRRRIDGGKPFYSALLDVVEFGKGLPRKANAQQWTAWLDGAQRRGECKAAERAWTGVDEWLSDQQGTITRDQLIAYVKANVVPLEEVVLGQLPKLEALCSELEWTVRASDGVITILDDCYNEVDLDNAPENIKDALQEAIVAGDGPTIYDGLQLPGGGLSADEAVFGVETYREILLCLPGADESSLKAAGHALRVAEDQIRGAEGDGANAEQLAPLYEAFRAASSEFHEERLRLNRANFSAPHFKNNRNILAHVRFAERRTPDGERVLLIEEVQSDWHQSGRSSGYRDKAMEIQVAALKTHVKALDDECARLALDRHPVTKCMVEERRWFELMNKGDELRREIDSLEQGRVPDAPFKRSEEWAMLAIKRIARWAAESPSRYKHIAWTTGDSQVRRYSSDLRQSVDKIDWVFQGDRQTVATYREGKLTFSCKVDLEGTVVYSSHRPAVGMTLEKLFGENVAAKIRLAPNGKLVEENLYVGGEGMRGFYDKILPTAVARWAKQFGAAVKQTSISTGTIDDASLELLLPDEADRLDEFVSFRSISVDASEEGRDVESRDLSREEAAAALAAGQSIWAEAPVPSVTAHCVEVNAAMSQSVMEGMPMFKRSGDNAHYERDEHGNLTVRAAAPRVADDTRDHPYLPAIRRRLGITVEDEPETLALKF